jgi:hypothetical protein
MPVRASDVLVGLLTENTPRMLVQAIRLLRSIRWFGGELANARVIVCGVGPLEARARETLEALGAGIRTVTRFHPASPTGNRHQLLAELLKEPERLLFLLDCDTIVVRDPLPSLRDDAFQAKIAPSPTVSDEVFERLFAHFGLPKPPRSHVTGFDGSPTIPYFNAGVFAVPRTIAATLAPSWRRFNQILADNPHLAAPCQRHMHQAALTLAIAETKVPYHELPDELNFQINAQQLPAPPGYAETDPAIIHYHERATDDGFLLPCVYPVAQSHIERFHARMRAEGFTPGESPGAKPGGRPIVVLGMHRSGTSAVTSVLEAMGAHAGAPDELAPGDPFNPNGYWEHRGAVALDTEVLDSLSANWSDGIERANVSRLSAAQRDQFVERARTISGTLAARGTFVIKDPRMSLIFPLWREALDNPVCVIVFRDPLAVARSLFTRDRQPTLVSLAAWDHHYRTILHDTAGLPRVLVSYEELLREPGRVIGGLHAELTRLGVSGLQVPTDERIRQTVNPDFNRSGPAAETETTLLDPDQRALYGDLRSGAALQNNVVPTSARVFALLAEFGEARKRETVLRGDVAELDQLLGAVFDSRSWRTGHRLSTILQRLRGSGGPSAESRWQESRRRRRPRT